MHQVHSTVVSAYTSHMICSPCILLVILDLLETQFLTMNVRSKLAAINSFSIQAHEHVYVKGHANSGIPTRTT